MFHSFEKIYDKQMYIRHIKQFSDFESLTSLMFKYVLTLISRYHQVKGKVRHYPYIPVASAPISFSSRHSVTVSKDGPVKKLKTPS